MGMRTRDISEHLKNPWIAAAFVAVVMTITRYVNAELWAIGFTVIMTYLIADLAANMIIKGGRGIVQFPLSGNTQTKSSGHGFLFFIASIAVGTFLSDYFWVNIKNSLTTSNELPLIIIANGLLVGAAYADFYARFYKR